MYYYVVLFLVHYYYYRNKKARGVLRPNETHFISFINTSVFLINLLFYIMQLNIF